MSRLKLYLFGPPRLEANAVGLDVRPRKAMALLIYLAVTHQPHSRDALATLFWPESDQVAARASLRRTLYLLQQALPADLLDSTGDSIRLATEGGLWIDSAEFQRLVDAASSPSSAASLSPAAREALLAAATLYTNDFLAGFTLDDAPAFDEWQFFQQESLRQRLAHVLLQLKQSDTAAGDFTGAIDHARRWTMIVSRYL
jgi:DNA-binding SARP family transcriptional activator